MADNDEDGNTSDVSEDESFDNFDGFDLVNVNRNELDHLEPPSSALTDDSDDGEEEFDGFDSEDTYVPSDFSNWTKTKNHQKIYDFTESVGPTHIFNGGQRALDYFQIFYSDAVFAEIARFTNINANIKQAQGDKGVWIDVTVEEIKAYYGLLLIMDTMKFNKDEHYWSNNDKHWLLGSKFELIMSYDRYVRIERYLHFSDDRSADNMAGDKLHKVRFLLDRCRQTFQAEYVPHKQIFVDEAMIHFKGRLAMKEHVKDKPVKFGMKLWVLADAVTAYCYNFDVYIGKHADVVNEDLGLSAKVVVALTKPLEMKGYQVYTNNSYTSPHLADYLYGRHTYLCGTMRTNRKGFPKALVQSEASARRLNRGAFDWLMCGPLVASFWKDNRIVYYLSSCHEPEDDELKIVMRNKDGTARLLSCTPAVSACAQYMLCTDKVDQNTKLNKEKKTMRWYRRVEIKLRECALYNAYVIEGTVLDHHQQGQRIRDLLSFRMDVAHQLIGSFRQPRKALKRQRLINYGEEQLHDKVNWSVFGGGSDRLCGEERLDEKAHLPVSGGSSDILCGEERLDEKAHWPVSSGSCDRLCVVCNKRHKDYKASHPGVTMGENPFKRAKTTMMCQKCQVPLCCNARNVCFRNYHTKVNYWQ